MGTARPSFVYFIQCNGSDGPIKIGSSFDPRLRRLQLQVASPYELQTVSALMLPCDWIARGVEREIHEWFLHQAQRGEWYTPAVLPFAVAMGEVDRWLRAVVYQPYHRSPWATAQAIARQMVTAERGTDWALDWSAVATFKRISRNIEQHMRSCSCAGDEAFTDVGPSSASSSQEGTSSRAPGRSEGRRR